MVNLKDYREYWERVAERLNVPAGVLPLTLDKEMGKKIQGLPVDSFTLFILPPLAESEAKNIDNFKEANQCVIFVMKKYNPQRVDSFAVLEETQPIVEHIKQIMLNDQAAGCPVMRIDAGRIDTAPETELYGNFAGWSIGFNVNSY